MGADGPGEGDGGECLRPDSGYLVIYHKSILRQESWHDGARMPEPKLAKKRK